MGRCQCKSKERMLAVSFVIWCSLVNCKGSTDVPSNQNRTLPDTHRISESIPVLWTADKLGVFTQSSIQPSTESSINITHAHSMTTNSREEYFYSTNGTTNKSEPVYSSEVKTTGPSGYNKLVTSSAVIDSSYKQDWHGSTRAIDILRVESTNKPNPDSTRELTTSSTIDHKKLTPTRSFKISSDLTEKTSSDLKKIQHYDQTSSWSNPEMFRSFTDLNALQSSSNEFDHLLLTSDHSVHELHPSSLYSDSEILYISSSTSTNQSPPPTPSEIKTSAVVIQLTSSTLTENTTNLYPSNFKSSAENTEQNYSVEAVAFTRFRQINNVTNVPYQSQSYQTAYSSDLQSIFQSEIPNSEERRALSTTVSDRREQPSPVIENKTMDTHTTPNSILVQGMSETFSIIPTLSSSITVDISTGGESLSLNNIVKKGFKENLRVFERAMNGSFNNIPTMSSRKTVNESNITDGEETNTTTSMPQNMTVREISELSLQATNDSFNFTPKLTFQVTVRGNKSTAGKEESTIENISQNITFQEISKHDQNVSLKTKSDLFQSLPTASYTVNRGNTGPMNHKIAKQNFTSQSFSLQDHSSDYASTVDAVNDLLIISPTASVPLGVYSGTSTENYGIYADETMSLTFNVKKSKTVQSGSELFSLSPEVSSSFAIYSSKRTSKLGMTMQPHLSKQQTLTESSINVQPMTNLVSSSPTTPSSLDFHKIKSTERTDSNTRKTTLLSVTSEKPPAGNHDFVQAVSYSLSVSPTVPSSVIGHAGKNTIQNVTQGMLPVDRTFEEKTTDLSIVDQTLKDSMSTATSYLKKHESQISSQNNFYSHETISPIHNSKTETNGVVQNSLTPLKSLLPSISTISETVIFTENPHSVRPSESTTAEMLDSTYSFESIPVSLQPTKDTFIYSSVSLDHSVRPSESTTAEMLDSTYSFESIPVSLQPTKDTFIYSSVSLDHSVRPSESTTAEMLDSTYSSESIPVSLQPTKDTFIYSSVSLDHSVRPSESTTAEMLDTTYSSESIPVSLQSTEDTFIYSSVSLDKHWIDRSTKSDSDFLWKQISVGYPVSGTVISNTVNTLNSIRDTPIDSTIISFSLINPTSSYLYSAAKTHEEETSLRMQKSLDLTDTILAEAFNKLKTSDVTKSSSHGNSNQQQFSETPFNTILSQSTSSTPLGKKTLVKSQQTSSSVSFEDLSHFGLRTSDYSFSDDIYLTTTTEPLLSSARYSEFLSPRNTPGETQPTKLITDYLSSSFVTKHIPSASSSVSYEMSTTVYQQIQYLESFTTSLHEAKTLHNTNPNGVTSPTNNKMEHKSSDFVHSISRNTLDHSYYPSFSSEYMSVVTAVQMKDLARNPFVNSEEAFLQTSSRKLQTTASRYYLRESDLSISVKERDKTDFFVSSSLSFKSDISSHSLLASAINFQSVIPSDDVAQSLITGYQSPTTRYTELLSNTYSQSKQEHLSSTNFSKIHMKTLKSDQSTKSSSAQSHLDTIPVTSSNVFPSSLSGGQFETMTAASVNGKSFLNANHLVSRATLDPLSTRAATWTSTEYITTIQGVLLQSSTRKEGSPKYSLKTTIPPDDKYEKDNGLFSVLSPVHDKEWNTKKIESEGAALSDAHVLSSSFILPTESYSTEMLFVSTQKIDSFTTITYPTSEIIGVDSDVTSSKFVKSTFSTNTVPSPSVTVFLFPEWNLLVIEIDVKTGIDITNKKFIDKLIEGLTTIYVEGMSGRKKRSSNQHSNGHPKDTGISVKIRDINRKYGERVEIIFLVTYSGIVVSASLAELTFQKMSDIEMSAILGYPVVVPVARLSTRSKPPPGSDGWGQMFNPLVITLITLPASIVLIATIIAIALRCRSKSVHRYPSVTSHMDSLYKHNLVVDVENGDVRNRQMSYDYPSDDEYSMASSDVFNEIKSKYSHSMHSKIKNFEKVNIKNHIHNQLERKPSDALRNKVTFGLDSEERKGQCVKKDSNESNDSGVVSDTPKSPTHETENLKLEVADATVPQNAQAQKVQQNNSHVAPKTVLLQNPYPVKKKSNLSHVCGERVTSWVFTNIPNEQSEIAEENNPGSDNVTPRDCDNIPPHDDQQSSTGDHDVSPDHIYETLNRKETAKSDPNTNTGISGSDGFEYLEPLRQLLLAVEQQRRRIPPVHAFLNDENVFRNSVQGLCNIGPVSPSYQCPQTGGQVPPVSSTNNSNCDSSAQLSDSTDSIDFNKIKEQQLVQGSVAQPAEVAVPDTCIYDQPVLYPAGFAHTADI